MGLGAGRHCKAMGWGWAWRGSCSHSFSFPSQALITHCLNTRNKRERGAQGGSQELESRGGPLGAPL